MILLFALTETFSSKIKINIFNTILYYAYGISYNGRNTKLYVLISYFIKTLITTLNLTYLSNMIHKEYLLCSRRCILVIASKSGVSLI